MLATIVFHNLFRSFVTIFGDSVSILSGLSHNLQGFSHYFREVNYYLPLGNNAIVTTGALEWHKFLC